MYDTMSSVSQKQDNISKACEYPGGALHWPHAGHPSAAQAGGGVSQVVSEHGHRIFDSRKSCHVLGFRPSLSFLEVNPYQRYVFSLSN